MNIDSYKFDNGMIRVKINGVDREFVYFDYKFNTKAELLAEIKKSINLEDKKTKIKIEKKIKLESELKKCQKLI